ncbi:MAG: restriction endonuclease subunit S, partial [Elusimicrobiota bacterium]
MYIKFPIPPTKAEQTAIATVLSDIDVLIEGLEKLIAKKKAIKQGAMQQFLTGKKRLPGFSEEWELKKLGEVSEIKTGKKNNEDKNKNGAYPFFVRSQTVEH